MCRNKLVLSAILLVLQVFLVCGTAFAAEKAAPNDRVVKNDRGDPWFFSFYNRYISPVDGDRCSMHPSCSRYSAEAFKRYGLFMGWIMTSDRLVRCGGDKKKLSPILINNKIRFHDPVDSGDFR